MAIQDVSVVLAHGAWADGSSWAPVISALTAESTKVVAAPLPLTSLADDVAALDRSLDRCGRHYPRRNPLGNKQLKQTLATMTVRYRAI